MATEVRYHYTIRAYLPLILRDGFLKLATAGVLRNERPAVWFSTNPVWEETANKLQQTPTGLKLGTRETTEKYGGGLIRFVVAPETAPHNWPAFRRLSGILHKHATALAMAGIKQGADPRQWWANFEPVPREKWLAIEGFIGGAWVALDLGALGAAGEVTRIHIDALFSDGVKPNLSLPILPGDLVNAADVLIGVDVDSQREFLLYGRESLQRVVDSGVTTRLRTLRIEMDQDTDDLEKAVALVELVKGRHEYESGA